MGSILREKNDRTGGWQSSALMTAVNLPAGRLSPAVADLLRREQQHCRHGLSITLEERRIHWRLKAASPKGALRAPTRGLPMGRRQAVASGEGRRGRWRHVTSFHAEWMMRLPHWQCHWKRVY